MNILKLSVIAGAAIYLSGCAVGKSDYACSGLAEGVNCTSARDVYTMTDDPNFQTVLQRENAEKARKESGESGDASGSETVVLRETPGEQYITPRPARNPLPIRTPATVMRIGFAPWEDEKGDLNVPGYIYTEIEPRRWEVGAERPPETPTLRPLQVQSVSPSTHLPSVTSAPHDATATATATAKSARQNAQGMR